MSLLTFSAARLPKAEPRASALTLSSTTTQTPSKIPKAFTEKLNVIAKDPKDLHGA